MKTFHTDHHGDYYELNAVGLKERLAQVGLQAGMFKNKKSRIVYYASFYDDIKDKVILLQDTGQRGGVGRVTTSPETLKRNYDYIEP